MSAPDLEPEPEPPASPDAAGERAGAPSLELRRLQRLASDAHVRALSAELASNRDVVVSARDDVNASWHVRLKAAAMLEDSLLRWLDVAEFEERLRALEDALGHETN